jgi:hypothetical protein
MCFDIYCIFAVKNKFDLVSVALQRRASLSETWNVRSLYRTGSLKTVARELETYKLDLVGVQEVR